LIVVASIVVHCCAIKKNIIVASQLYDVADVQFTVDRQTKRVPGLPMWLFWSQILKFWPFFEHLWLFLEIKKAGLFSVGKAW